ncbi:MAG TPA: polysaccharide biosynthesis/export family protein, partial [Chitinophaga sp.]
MPTATMSRDQLKQVKVDQLSDDQIRQLVSEMKKNKITFDQVDEYAAENGIPDTEVTKLKMRIQALGLDKELTAAAGKDTSGESTQETTRQISDSTDDWDERLRRVKSKEDYEKELRRRKIFGTELFSNKNLTFEPNLRMPTPPNYRIAANDELLIDVYGYSEVQHQLKVTPDGYVRIPYLGPVYVNGLTMEEARVRITKQLSS